MPDRHDIPSDRPHTIVNAVKDLCMATSPHVPKQIVVKSPLHRLVLNEDSISRSLLLGRRLKL